MACTAATKFPWMPNTELHARTLSGSIPRDMVSQGPLLEDSVVRALDVLAEYPIPGRMSVVVNQILPAIRRVEKASKGKRKQLYSAAAQAIKDSEYRPDRYAHTAVLLGCMGKTLSDHVIEEELRKFGP